ncbi:unnamed protein product [Arabis nemorensis]|uniref:Protein kinase domain-containing protein n=1 Tax=Arabis nemorensis TaxID=586526 RepID=A0A565AN00_9BRAS|nr:unnamed protein product [Arabis nemorensis]
MTSSVERIVLPTRIFKLGTEPYMSLKYINRYGRREKKLVKKLNVKCIIGNPNLHSNLVSKVIDVEFKKVIDIVQKGYKLKRADWVNGYIDVPVASRQPDNQSYQSRRNENRLVDSETAARETSREALRFCTLDQQLDKLYKYVEERFQGMEDRFKTMDDRLLKIEEKINQIHTGHEEDVCQERPDLGDTQFMNEGYTNNTVGGKKEEGKDINTTKKRVRETNENKKDSKKHKKQNEQAADLGRLSIAVGALKLLENSCTWNMGEQIVPEMPHLSTRLKNWLISKKLNRACGYSSTLSKILENSATPLEPICNDDAFDSLALKTSETSSASNSSGFRLIPGCADSLAGEDLPVRKIKTEEVDFEDELKRLSLMSNLISPHLDFEKSFLDLLSACGQMQPSNFMDAFSKFCEPESIVKIGEGTYGEAFQAGPCVCKIVPIDGDLRVNGEIQKEMPAFSCQLLSEQVMVNVIIKVCQGPYDPILIKAWEEWDAKHGSENDHPDFPEKQCYVMFVLEHGGQDLESFVLLNFDEARSLLVQVTAGLAVAEAAFEFEHRDLHS